MKLHTTVQSIFQITLLILITFILLSRCTENVDELPEPEVEPELLSTFDIIQHKIFRTNCVSCHQKGTSFANQSDLILTRDEAYDQLVNRVPHNASAKKDGLILVGTNGLADISRSFLWEKLLFRDFEHYFSDHSEYGELMPLGGRSLTDGALEFIHEWMLKGAPKDGFVADENLLLNTDRFEIPDNDYNALEPPASGYQLILGPFDVWQNAERELFQYQRLNNSEEIYVNRVEINMRSGSHHFIINDHPQGKIPEEGVYRDFWTPAGNFNFTTAESILDARFVYGTQWRETDYHYPPGVALKIPANAGFDLNSHYVNRTDELKSGEISVNLHTVPKSAVNFVAENLFECYEDFQLPPHQVTTLVRESTFDEEMFVFQLTSHAHEHMTEFRIYINGGQRDGELIFFTNDWEHPPLLEFDPPIVINRGEGFRAEATYDNQTDRTLRFGLLSEDEMMIIFGAFYRKL